MITGQVGGSYESGEITINIREPVVSLYIVSGKPKNCTIDFVIIQESTRVKNVRLYHIIPFVGRNPRQISPTEIESDGFKIIIYISNRNTIRVRIVDPRKRKDPHPMGEIQDLYISYWRDHAKME